MNTNFKYFAEIVLSASKNRFFIISIILLSFCTRLRAEIHTGSCGTNVTWAFNTETGILAISGTGNMADYSYSNQPWYSYRSQISSIKIN